MWSSPPDPGETTSTASTTSEARRTPPSRRCRSSAARGTTTMSGTRTKPGCVGGTRPQIDIDLGDRVRSPGSWSSELAAAARRCSAGARRSGVAAITRFPSSQLVARALWVFGECDVVGDCQRQPGRGGRGRAVMARSVARGTDSSPVTRGCPAARRPPGLRVEPHGRPGCSMVALLHSDRSKATMPAPGDPLSAPARSPAPPSAPRPPSRRPASAGSRARPPPA